MNLRRTARRYTGALEYDPPWGKQEVTTLGDVVDDLRAAAGAVIKPQTDELRKALRTITVLAGIAAVTGVMALVVK